MRSLKLGIIALFLGTIGFINTSLAADTNYPQPCPMMHNMHMMHETMHNCTQYQQLNADQKAKVDKIMQDHKAKIKPLVDQLWSKKEALDKEFMMPKLNEDTISSLEKEMSGLHSQIFASHIQARVDMAKIGFNAMQCWESMHPMMKHKMKQKEMMHGSMPEAPAQGMQTAPQQNLQSGATQGLSK